jgi:hypothetical protein
VETETSLCVRRWGQRKTEENRRKRILDRIDRIYRILRGTGIQDVGGKKAHEAQENSRPDSWGAAKTQRNSRAWNWHKGRGRRMNRERGFR